MSAIDFSDPKTIAFLTEALTAAGVDGLEISSASGNLRIVVSGGESHVSHGVKASSKPAVIKAPMAGIFQPRNSASADLPHAVAAADVLGFLRVGDVLVPLQAGHSGVLNRRLIEPGTLVGFGDALFEIEAQS
ncbi:acetyl-CoA carboxylase [Rhizobium sp. CSW-27]|uniref:acetyl-CoA carboxylase n=1 Tax=Rhizobium sp. CSW-27 TaxID=2839985 RepID=UPI001C023CE3|nr:acetyl-CoA carboxylase [Rhizobium sp. CSW-27]MBT9372947.1 acetyl-CoA carboxylase [Rhizobium sp. CSW-27]